MPQIAIMRPPAPPSGTRNLATAPIVGVNVVLNMTVVVDSEWRFDNLCGSHLQSELYHVS